MTKDSYQEPGLCPIMSLDFFLYISVFLLEILGVDFRHFPLHMVIGCKRKKTTNIVSFCRYFIQISRKTPEAYRFLRTNGNKYWEFACHLIILHLAIFSKVTYPEPRKREWWEPQSSLREQPFSHPDFSFSTWFLWLSS